jgi:hypothetical protein
MMTSFAYYIVVFFKYMQLGYQLRVLQSRMFHFCFFNSFKIAEKIRFKHLITTFRIVRRSLLLFGLLSGLFLGILSCVGERSVSRIIHDTSAGAFFVSVLLHTLSNSILDIITLIVGDHVKRSIIITRLVLTGYQCIVFVLGLTFFILKERSPVLYSIAAIMEYLYSIGCLIHMVTIGIEFGNFDFTFRVSKKD